MSYSRVGSGFNLGEGRVGEGDCALLNVKVGHVMHDGDVDVDLPDGRGATVKWRFVHPLTAQARITGGEEINRLVVDRMAADLTAKDREIAAFEAEKKRVLATLETVAKQRDDARAEIAALREALEGMLHEWDKFTRYGSPMAKAANENVARARAALEMSGGVK
jgi:hypothetical protein